MKSPPDDSHPKSGLHPAQTEEDAGAGKTCNMDYAVRLRYAILTLSFALPECALLSGQFTVTLRLTAEGRTQLLACILTR